jgi:prepilin-type N-terminal cleavage/methylation domain-containing protein
MKKRTQGFTLIELLVVISIIGLLSSIVLASLNTARSKARDAKRKQDLHQIQIALELYYSTYGGYPSSAYPTVDYRIPGSIALEPKMLNVIPVVSSDPVLPGNCYNTQYTYVSDSYNNGAPTNPQGYTNANATTYVLYATLENQRISNLSNTGIDAFMRSYAGQCGSSATPNYRLGVYN